MCLSWFFPPQCLQLKIFLTVFMTVKKWQAFQKFQLHCNATFKAYAFIKPPIDFSSWSAFVNSLVVFNSGLNTNENIMTRHDTVYHVVFVKHTQKQILSSSDYRHRVAHVPTLYGAELMRWNHNDRDLTIRCLVVRVSRSGALKELEKEWAPTACLT